MASDHSRGAAWLLVIGIFSLLACERKQDIRPAPSTVAAAPSAPQATSRGPVLVVLSSRNELALKDGRTFKTGYFLNELMIPVRALVAAHYQPVFATPRGGPAVMDTHSDSPSFFANEAEYREIVALRHRLNDVQETRVLASIVSEGLGSYRALLVPGGHAAMGDLAEDAELGKALRYFHEHGKPTAVICHGPAALLSTLPAPGAFIRALAEANGSAATAASAGFPYAGYRVAAFTTAEEQAVEEGGSSAMLGGKVQFYLDQALSAAGAKPQIGAPFKSNVVVDRELISAQQPASDVAFTQALLDALQKSEVGALPRN